MSDRPTPETDAECNRDELDHVDTEFGLFRPSDVVSADFARKLERERDEAREAFPNGEWVAHEDYKKIHDAASRLLVAINKKLPIGCFTLIGSEYYRLQNAIYGREATK